MSTDEGFGWRVHEAHFVSYVDVAIGRVSELHLWEREGGRGGEGRD